MIGEPSLSPALSKLLLLFQQEGEGTAAAESLHSSARDQRPQQSAEGKEAKPGTVCDAKTGARTPRREPRSEYGSSINQGINFHASVFTSVKRG